MAGRVAGKVAIVTGAASGMGRAGATLLAAEGAKVVIADINQVKGEEVSRAICDSGGQAVFMPVDVCDVRSVEQLAERTASQFDGIDVLYHNAVDVQLVNKGDRRLTELPEQTWDKIIDLVLSGTFRCCKYIGRKMIEQKSGSIILTATTDALIGCAGLDSYTAAKGGVVSLTRSFAAGMARDGVRVNAICPGFVLTEPMRGFLADPESKKALDFLHLLPIATPEQIAPFVVYLSSDESAVVTGGIFPIDSGYMAFKAHANVSDLQRNKG